MIIGISGKKQHGKDLTANIIEYIIDEHFHHSQLITPFEDWSKVKGGNYTHHWQKKQFAGKLKQIVCLLIGCTMEQLEDNNFKEKELGEEWRVWYCGHYKLKNDFNPLGRFGRLHTTKEEAENEVKKWQLEEPNTTFTLGNLKVESYLLTPRLLLQYIGTDCGRNLVHPNIWVNATMADYIYQKDRTCLSCHTSFNFDEAFYPSPEIIKSDYYCPKCKSANHAAAYLEKNCNWIITDVRFPNEVEAIKAKGGIVIRVVRYGIGGGDNHPSETALDNYKGFDFVKYEKGGFDEVIYNRGSISDMITDVKALLQTFKII